MLNLLLVKTQQSLILASYKNCDEFTVKSTLFIAELTQLCLWLFFNNAAPQPSMWFVIFLVFHFFFTFCFGFINFVATFVD